MSYTTPFTIHFVMPKYDSSTDAMIGTRLVRVYDEPVFEDLEIARLRAEEINVGLSSDDECHVVVLDAHGKEVQFITHLDADQEIPF